MVKLKPLIKVKIMVKKASNSYLIWTLLNLRKAMEKFEHETAHLVLVR